MKIPSIKIQTMKVGTMKTDNESVKAQSVKIANTDNPIQRKLNFITHAMQLYKNSSLKMT